MSLWGAMPDLTWNRFFESRGQRMSGNDFGVKDMSYEHEWADQIIALCGVYGVKVAPKATVVHRLIEAVMDRTADLIARGQKAKEYQSMVSIDRPFPDTTPRSWSFVKADEERPEPFTCAFCGKPMEKSALLHEGQWFCSEGCQNEAGMPL